MTHVGNLSRLMLLGLAIGLTHLWSEGLGYSVVWGLCLGSLGVGLYAYGHGARSRGKESRR